MDKNKQQDQLSYQFKRGTFMGFFLVVFGDRASSLRHGTGTIMDIRRSGVGVDMAQGTDNSATIASALYPELLSSHRITILPS